MKNVLPFDSNNLPIRISQGNHGPWSHYLIRREIPGDTGKFSETDLSYAVDFALPLDTEVRAAADGIVFGLILTSDFCYEGLDPEVGNNLPPLSTNLIMLEHFDGTMSLYSHLSRMALVERGQKVSAGEVIGYTGKSGWIAEIPHLHFQVCLVSKPNKSVPCRFVNYEGELDHVRLTETGELWVL